jgi:hypothetical protein
MEGIGRVYVINRLNQRGMVSFGSVFVLNGNFAFPYIAGVGLEGEKAEFSPV